MPSFRGYNVLENAHPPFGSKRTHYCSTHSLKRILSLRLEQNGTSKRASRASITSLMSLKTNLAHSFLSCFFVVYTNKVSREKGLHLEIRVLQSDVKLLNLRQPVRKILESPGSLDSLARWPLTKAEN